MPGFGTPAPDAATLLAWARRHLARHPASAARLRAVLERRLLRRHGPEAAAQAAGALAAALERLRREGQLDDALYGRAVAGSDRARGRSARAIRWRLGRDGVAPELVDAALERAGTGDLEALLAALRRRRIGPFAPRPEPPEARARTFRWALARGFPAAVVGEALRWDPEGGDGDG